MFSMFTYLILLGVLALVVLLVLFTRVGLYLNPYANALSDAWLKNPRVQRPKPQNENNDANQIGSNVGLDKK
jgi:hypothetical protein